MFDSECARCKKCLDCKGKDSHEPCVCFEDRREVVIDTLEGMCRMMCDNRID